jgi:hypothetical protein
MNRTVFGEVAEENAEVGAGASGGSTKLVRELSTQMGRASTPECAPVSGNEQMSLKPA